MKRALPTFVILLSGCSFAPIQKPVGHVVLGVEQARSADRANPSSLAAAMDPANYWSPTEGEISELETDLAALFAKPDSRVVGARKWERLSDYLIRYYGSVRNGKKVIVAQAEAGRDLESFRIQNSGPDVVHLRAFGAESHYFTAIYDPVARKVLLVQFTHFDAGL